MLRVQAVVILAGRTLCLEEWEIQSTGQLEPRQAVPCCMDSVQHCAVGQAQAAHPKGLPSDSFCSALVVIPPAWPCLYITVHQEVLVGTYFIFDCIELFPHKKIVWNIKMREYLLWRGSAWLAAPGSEPYLMLHYLEPPALRGNKIIYAILFFLN